MWFEVGELSGELVDALLEFEIALLLGGGVCSGVGEFVPGALVEVVEPVGDLTPRCERRRWGWGGGEFASDDGGRVVGSVGGEDLFEDVDGVVDVVGVGDDADEVLGLAAGDGDTYSPRQVVAPVARVMEALAVSDWLPGSVAA